MGSLSHYRVNHSRQVGRQMGDNLGMSFRSSLQYVCVECTHLNRLDDTILMSTHTIHFHVEIRLQFQKMSINICWLELSKEFHREHYENMPIQTY